LGADINNIIGISCSIFRKEIEKLIEEKRLSIPFVFLDSMLHMNPEKLQMELNQRINEEELKDKKIAIIYGECHPYFDKYYYNEKIEKIEGMNCVEIILGKVRYRALRKEGVFFLLNEWVWRWEDVFKIELGLNNENAKNLMEEMHSKLLDLDTGVSPVPYDILNQISDFTGLKYEMFDVTLDNLCNSINKIIERFNNK
jgi:hypothetical protein